VKRLLAFLIGGTLAAWILVLYPARILVGEFTTLYGTVAMALCLVPAAGTLAWSWRAMEWKAEQQIIVILGGTGLRMVWVLVGGLAICGLFPAFQQASFWIFILVFYLVTLGLEMILIVGQLKSRLGQN
jgi:hypothetical protein